MKNRCLRKTATLVYRVLLGGTVCEMIVLWLNRKYSEPWQLLFYDLHIGFIDNRNYLIDFFLLFGIFVLLYIFYIACNKDGFSFEWHIRLGKKKQRCFIWKSYWVILGCVCICFLGITSVICDGVINCGKGGLWEGSTVIKHSFGSIDGYCYTGSLEAFLENYEKGDRIFEVDLEMTSDDKVILRHDWDLEMQEGISSENIPTQEQFLSVPIYGIYTPLSFRDLCLLMQEYPDIWIVTDSKYKDWDNVIKQFTIMVRTAEECNAAEVLDRLVVQIYDEFMYEALKEVYPFRSFIFTLYQRWDGKTVETCTQICRWSVEKNIDMITMPYSYATEENLEVTRRYGREVYVHTINDAAVAKDFFEKGIRGIYTDDLCLKELEEEKE